jgi:hypothetical protein
MTNRNLTCEALDAALADYLEGSLSDSEVADVELHLSGCVRCTALVRDFETITRTAAALPALVPSHDLWPGINARLDATVIPIGSRGSSRASTWHRVRLGAVAAGLVGITALVTYTLTRQQMAPDIATVAPAGSRDTGTGKREPGTDTLAPSSSPVSPTAPPQREIATAPRANRAATTPVAHPVRADARTTYDTEIIRLRAVVNQRADQLDPATVAIIESSLKTIDSAIIEARIALSRDPASRFLSSQVDKALEKKLGLLRTAALLPART